MLKLFNIVFKTTTKNKTKNYTKVQDRHSKSKFFYVVRIKLNNNFCADLCAEIAIKNLNNLRLFLRFFKKYEKVPIWQVLRSKVNILQRF